MLWDVTGRRAAPHPAMCTAVACTPSHLPAACLLPALLQHPRAAVSRRPSAQPLPPAKLSSSVGQRRWHRRRLLQPRWATLRWRRRRTRPACGWAAQAAHRRMWLPCRPTWQRRMAGLGTPAAARARTNTFERHGARTPRCQPLPDCLGCIARDCPRAKPLQRQVATLPHACRALQCLCLSFVCTSGKFYALHVPAPFLVHQVQLAAEMCDAAPPSTSARHASLPTFSSLPDFPVSISTLPSLSPLH